MWPVSFWFVDICAVWNIGGQLFHDGIPSGGIWICRRTHLPRTGRNLIRAAQCVRSDFRHRVHCSRWVVAGRLRRPRLQRDVNVGFVHWSHCDNVHPSGTQTSEGRQWFQIAVEPSSFWLVGRLCHQFATAGTFAVLLLHIYMDHFFLFQIKTRMITQLFNDDGVEL